MLSATVGLGVAENIMKMKKSDVGPMNGADQFTTKNRSYSIIWTDRHFLPIDVNCELWCWCYCPLLVSIIINTICELSHFARNEPHSVGDKHVSHRTLETNSITGVPIFALGALRTNMGVLIIKLALECGERPILVQISSIRGFWNTKWFSSVPKFYYTCADK